MVRVFTHVLEQLPQCVAGIADVTHENCRAIDDGVDAVFRAD